MEYTLDYLIGEWKMRRGLIPLRIDAAIKRQDAFEIDEYARREIDTWYNGLLMTAPTEMLDVENITELVTVGKPERGVAVMTLPSECLRLVGVKMTVWEREAVVVSSESRIGKRQGSPFSRGGVCHPVAVTDGHKRVMLYGFRNGCDAVAERVLGVMRPPGGIYRFNPAMLEDLLSKTY